MPADGDSKCRLGGCVFLDYNSGAILSYSKSDTLNIPPYDNDDIDITTLYHSSCEAEIKGVVNQLKK